MTRRWRRRSGAVLLGLAGSALAWAALTVSWTAGGTVAPQPGRAVLPAAYGLALAGLAGSAALLLVRHVGRLLVGGILVGIALGMVVTSTLAMAASVDWVGAGWAGALLVVLGGLGVALAGLSALIGGPGWTSGGAGASEPSPIDAWQALDAGLDPTVAEFDDTSTATGGPTRTPAGPDDRLGLSDRLRLDDRQPPG